MAVKVTTDGSNGRLGDIVSFSVSEDATPVVVGDSSGSVGQINIAARAITKGPIKDRSVGVIGTEVTLTDERNIEHVIGNAGYGTIRGLINDAPVVGERINISAETLRARFRTDRKVAPYYGSYINGTTSETARVNLFTNPEFETDLTGLSAVNIGTGAFATARPNDGGFNGTYYGSVVWSGANANSPANGLSHTFNVPLAGVSYTASAYFRIQRATTVPEGSPVQRISVRLRFYNAADAQVGSDVSYLQTVTTSDWTRASIAGLAPATAVKGRLFILSNTGTGYSVWKAGDTIDIDAALAEQGGLGDPFDGSLPDVVQNFEDGISIIRTYSWTGTANASTSVEDTYIYYPAKGYDATQGNYFRHLCSLVGISNPVIDAEFDRKPVAYPGWEGDVWTYLKDFCAAINAEIALADDTVILRKPRTRNVPIESISDFTVQTRQTQTAQFVEINNYNSYWGVDELAYQATSVFQVETGSTEFSEVSLPHFIEEPNNPIPVLEWDQGYVVGQGQYQVIDSQGLLVDPDWWIRNGGSVEVTTVYGEPNKLKIIVHAPYRDYNGYVGPWKIGRDYVEIIPALDLTGSGVFIDVQPVRIRTGVSAETTSTIVGSVIDNVFISNAELAYTKGLDAACEAAGPLVTISGTIGYDRMAEGQSFGSLIGGRVQIRDNIFRLTSVSYEPGGISFEGKADMLMSDFTDLFSYTFAEFNLERGPITFSEFNAAEGSSTFAEFNGGQATPTFEQFNTINDGVTFNTHAIFPNVNEVQVAEQTV